jgi:hypothetical protein
MRQNLLLLTILIFLSCCKKSGIEPGFNKFTPTDANGILLGEADPTDWTRDQSWSAAEKNLFNKPDTFDYADIGAAIQVSVRPAYPNSCRHLFTVPFTFSEPTIAKFALVDNRLRVLSYQEGKWTSQNLETIQFTIDDQNKFKPGKTYRLYYAFYNDKKEMIYFGHGDIKKAP